MDERQLKEILGAEEVPPADENARKQAINLALAAFDEAQRETRTKRQGFGLLRRLTGRDPTRSKGRAMRNSQVFGAVAMAMVLAVTTVVTVQFVMPPRNQGIFRMFDDGAGSVPRAWETPAQNYAQSQPDRRQPQRLSLPESDEGAGDTAPVVQRPAAAPLVAQSPSEQSAPGIEEWRKMRRTQQDVVQELLQEERMRSSLRRHAAGVIGPGQVEPGRPGHYQDVGRDQFQSVAQNPVKRVAEDPVSTFSIDVDTASYAFVRRQLIGGVLPQADAVRVEELINYFSYDYPLPESREQPFETTVTVTSSPWKPGNKLIHIGIKGYDIAPAEKLRSNLVFLLDVSGSMNAPDKLPLMVNSMKLLLGALGPEDTVAIVVYAGAAGTVLEPTKVAEKHKILAALDRLRAGGSTAGAAGIRQAYALAEASLDQEAVNRVILATDGDFNVGITNRDELKSFIERKRATGIFLSVLGFGQGNLNDHLMQTLAQNGNGVAAHIDTLNEARKVLVEEASSALFPIAKDVKIQVEFNPDTVAEYRLIGYETRALAREDFSNDKVDAGDIGAGHTVTAIYEITPVGSDNRMIEPSRYGTGAVEGGETAFADEYAFLKVRYKLPDQDRSTLITTPITLAQETPPGASAGEAQWAAAVAAFGQLLKGGKYTGDHGYDDVITLARGARGEDPFGYRAEFISLVRLAQSLSEAPKN